MTKWSGVIGQHERPRIAIPLDYRYPIWHTFYKKETREQYNAFEHKTAIENDITEIMLTPCMWTNNKYRCAIIDCRQSKEWPKLWRSKVKSDCMCMNYTMMNCDNRLPMHDWSKSDEHPKKLMLSKLMWSGWLDNDLVWGVDTESGSKCVGSTWGDLLGRKRKHMNLEGWLSSHMHI